MIVPVDGDWRPGRSLFQRAARSRHLHRLRHLPWRLQLRAAAVDAHHLDDRLPRHAPTASTPTPAPATTAAPLQAPSRFADDRRTPASVRGLTSISLGFGEALFPTSAKRAGLYRLLAAVKTHGTTVFRTESRHQMRPLRLQLPDGNDLPGPAVRGRRCEVKIVPGLVAANGASNTNELTIIVD